MPTVRLRVAKPVARALAKLGPVLHARMEAAMRAEATKLMQEARQLGITTDTHSLGVPEILEGMAATFRERNAIYGDNWRMVGKLMAVLFPDGVRLKAAEDYDGWHLFELIIVKLSRFAISGRKHEDSIHDIAVYAAMVEGIIKQRSQNDRSRRRSRR